MNIIIRIIIPLLISIILGFIQTSIEKHNSKEIIKNLTKEHIFIRLPNAYIWIGYLDISFFSICLFLMNYFPNDSSAIWVEVLFCLFILLGFVMIIVTKAWKIEIFRHKNYFLYQTVFFKTYTIKYNECIDYKWNENYLLLKTDKKKFYIDAKASNFEFLLSMLTQYKVKEIK